MYCILWGLFFLWPLAMSGQAGYYFVESGCRACRPGPDSRAGHYWLISDEAHPFTMGGGEREMDLIAADFRAEAAAHYPNYGELTGNTTIRRSESRLLAEQARDRRLEEMRADGYEVIERPFWFLSHRGIPEVDRYLVYANKLGFDGVALLAENDWVVHRRGYGRARENGALNHTPRSIFHIGALTQAFTAQAVFLLREVGGLKLSDNMGRIFRGAPADKKSITVEQLLRHTSGLPRELPPGDYASSAEVLDAILEMELLEAPGETYHYSEAGCQLLALIIQKITRQTYDQFLREQILEPFQMKNTGFYHDPPHADLTADGWRLPAIAFMSRIEPNSYAYLGSQGLMTTAEDLFRWFRTLSKLPFFNEMTRTQSDGETAHGFYLTEEGLIVGAGRAADHHVRLTYDRTRNRLVILLSNHDPYDAGHHTSLMASEIARIMNGERIDIPSWQDIRLEPFAGRYVDQGDTLEVVAADGRAAFQAFGQSLLDELTSGGSMAASLDAQKYAERYRAALLSGDWETLETMSAAGQADTLRQLLARNEADFGSLSFIANGGTITVDRPENNCRSTFRLYFGKARLDCRLYWRGGKVVEIRVGEHEPPLQGYLLPTANDELTFVELATGYRQSLHFSPDGQTVRVGEKVLRRVLGR